MRELRELSLFSGYGGFSLGLRLARLQTRTVMYVEWERYPQENNYDLERSIEWTLDTFLILDASLWAIQSPLGTFDAYNILGSTATRAIMVGSKDILRLDSPKFLIAEITTNIKPSSDAPTFTTKVFFS